MQHATLFFLVKEKEKQILLGFKKTSIGKGKFNGFGGKVEKGESAEQAALREMLEESGVEAFPEHTSKVGELTFYSGNKETLQDFFVHVFVAKKWKGNPTESREMTPKWFKFEEIPFNQMWPDDKHWLPLILQNKKVKGIFSFDEKNEKIKEFELKEIESEF